MGTYTPEYTVCVIYQYANTEECSMVPMSLNTHFSVHNITDYCSRVIHGVTFLQKQFHLYFFNTMVVLVVLVY